MRFLLITVVVTFLAGCSGISNQADVRHTYKNDNKGGECTVAKYEAIPAENIDTFDNDEITCYDDKFIYSEYIDSYDVDDITYDTESTFDAKCAPYSDSFGKINKI